MTEAPRPVERVTNRATVGTSTTIHQALRRYVFPKAKIVSTPTIVINQLPREVDNMSIAALPRLTRNRIVGCDSRPSQRPPSATQSINTRAAESPKVTGLPREIEPILTRPRRSPYGKTPMPTQKTVKLIPSKPAASEPRCPPKRNTQLATKKNSTACILELKVRVFTHDMTQ